MPSNLIGYLAPEGFVPELVAELGEVHSVHDRLVLAPGPDRRASWAQNIWFEPEAIAVKSIGEAVKELRARQRNWACYSFAHHRRAQLIQEQLPKVSSRPIDFLGEVPTAPLGSWTLLAPELLLASRRCASPFPNGEVRFNESKEAPSRAYLKLWELFTAHGVRPRPGERCLDLGSSPGGWTWVLQQLGCEVVSVDRAPLDPLVALLPGVTYKQGSAFALKPEDVGRVDWLFSDIICYPEKLLELVERWRASGLCRNFACTIKFQGATDFAVTERFKALPGARVLHLFHNKHELTFVLTAG